MRLIGSGYSRALNHGCRAGETLWWDYQALSKYSLDRENVHRERSTHYSGISLAIQNSIYPVN